MHEDGAVDDEVIQMLMTRSPLFVRSPTPCFPMTLSLFLLLQPTLALRSPSKSNTCVMECHQMSSAVSSGNHPCPLHLRFQWGRTPR